MGYRPIRKQFDCTVKKLATPRTHRFIGTNQSADRFGDVIEFEGWDTRNWEANPVILWNHKMDEPPIGKGRVRRVKDGKALVFDVEFASEEVYAFAATVEKLVDNGFINAVSVGMIPKAYEEIEEDEEEEEEDDEEKKKKKQFEEKEKEDEEEDEEDEEDEDKKKKEKKSQSINRAIPARRFMQQELLELSIVPVPMNPTALRLLSFSEKKLTINKGMSFLYDNIDEDDATDGEKYSAGINLILKSCRESNDRAADIFDKLMNFMELNNKAIVQFSDVVKNLAYLHDSQALDTSSSFETNEKSSEDMTVAYLEDLLSSAKNARSIFVNSLSKEEKVSNES